MKKLNCLANAQKIISSIEITKEGIFISKNLNPVDLGLSLHHCIAFALFSFNFHSSPVLPLNWLIGKYGFKSLWQIKLMLSDLRVLGYICKNKKGNLRPITFVEIERGAK